MKNGSIKTRISVFLLLCLFQVNIHAEIGKWKYYRAYQDATIVVETPHLVFAVYKGSPVPDQEDINGSLLSYNPEDKEIKLYSTQTGLSDINIQNMAYCPEANALVLIYDNANIDIFAGENEIYNLPFIKDDTHIPNKTIYNLEIIGKYAYISTGFGIVVVDVERKEIKDTYRLDVVTRSVCRWGDYLLAATDEGIKKAQISSNLLDKINWKPFEDLTLSKDDIPWVKKIFIFKDRFTIWKSDGVSYLFEPQNLKNLTGNARQATILNDRLVVVSAGEIAIYSDIDQVQRLSLDVNYVDCIHSTNRYWVGLAGEGGLAAIDKRDNASGYEMVVEGIKVDSPKRNLNFFMTFAAGKLLIAGGGRAAGRYNIPGTLMIYENGQWTNFDEKKISREAGVDCMDFMSVAVDPKNTNHYFVGSWGEGLLEFADNQFVKRYTDINTDEKIQSPSPNSSTFRIDGLVYDRNNNLFMVNGDIASGYALVELSADGKWENYFIEALKKTYPAPNRILIDRNGYKWLNIWRQDIGIVVCEENDTIYSNSFSDQLETSVNATGYYCLAEESNGTIWVGTDNGPILFSSPEQVKNGQCYRIVSQDQYGENFYLLEKEKINAMAIDGGDRKWLGSENSGVFLIEQSNGETNVENFNTSNSPILSNRINSIAINDETGEVFIGTDKGLCSYMSHVTPGKPDYSSGVHAFPNPVRPATDTQVAITGLMQNSTVKITDMAGNLIKQGQSTGSLFTWNCTNRSGETVKAGIYLVFAASADGSRGIVTKIMVIK